ncbi:MAG TPA: SusC/RagA family TonB-linked outer membrane protein, partial [Dysgonomonas sp.]|nr:SusC/RagA family TonB-linked outer membrane protein [Dysgonomonas sp.]
MENKRFKDAFCVKNPQIKQFFRIMRISVFFLFVCVFTIYADNSFSQNARVTINKSNTQIKEILSEIENQTDYLFIYNNRVDVKKRVNVDVNHTAVSKVLSSIFEGTDIGFSMEGSHIMLTVAEKNNDAAASSAGGSNDVQQMRAITGVVKDHNNDPV